MARGGARRGAGRKRGYVSERTKRKNDLVVTVNAAGITPVEVMTAAMRDLWEMAHAGETVDIVLKMQAVSVAEKVAPYLAPKLANVQHTGREGGPIQHQVETIDRPAPETREEWLARRRLEIDRLADPLSGPVAGSAD